MRHYYITAAEPLSWRWLLKMLREAHYGDYHIDRRAGHLMLPHDIGCCCRDRYEARYKAIQDTKKRKILARYCYAMPLLTIRCRLRVKLRYTPCCCRQAILPPCCRRYCYASRRRWPASLTPFTRVATTWPYYEDRRLGVITLILKTYALRYAAARYAVICFSLVTTLMLEDYATLDSCDTPRHTPPYYASHMMRYADIDYYYYCC